MATLCGSVSSLTSVMVNASPAGTTRQAVSNWSSSAVIVSAPSWASRHATDPVGLALPLQAARTHGEGQGQGGPVPDGVLHGAG